MLCHNISYQFSIDKQPVKGNGDNQQEENGDSDYSSSQLSEWESSDNSVSLEREDADDPTTLPQASSKKHSEANEKLRPTLIPLSGDLEGKLLPH